VRSISVVAMGGEVITTVQLTGTRYYPVFGASNLTHQPTRPEVLKDSANVRYRRDCHTS
jgi:hypothetical protein